VERLSFRRKMAGTMPLLSGTIERQDFHSDFPATDEVRAASWDHSVDFRFKWTSRNSLNYGHSELKRNVLQVSIRVHPKVITDMD